jgi:hypothetical protein
MVTALGCAPSAGPEGGNGAAGVGGGTAAGGTSAAATGSAGTPGAGGGGTGGLGTTAGGTGGSAGGAGGNAGGTTAVACTFNVSHSMSEAIPTVGIVQFSVDLPAIESATIEFGLDTSYGMSAPVDLAEPGYRTLLLGMKTGREYHFRASVISGGQPCNSQDFSLTTGELPNALGLPTVTTNAPERLAGGFLITARWGMSNDGPAFILDADNDMVWWYEGEDDVIRARMTYDGKALWLRNTAQADGTGVIHRVSMDGLNDERWEVPRTTHDLAVIPDGKLGLIAHADGGCDEIVEFDPSSGSLTPIFNVQEAHGQTDCHVNYLAYSAADDSFLISDWASSHYIKISRTGQLLWVLNGEGATISGASWARQHGIHVLAPNHLLIFSNGDPGASSLGLEYMLDETNGTATELWRYDADVQAQFGGDIQRLDNGNTLITYSSAGVIQEVASDSQLVQELVFPIGSTVSYAVKRDSLYGGPPPKIH